MTIELLDASSTAGTGSQRAEIKKTDRGFYEIQLAEVINNNADHAEPAMISLYSNTLERLGRTAGEKGGFAARRTPLTLKGPIRIEGPFIITGTVVHTASIQHELRVYLRRL